MSWLFSQGLVEAYLGDISLDGEQSVQSSGKPTQLAYLSQDKMTKYSRLSRFGMMFKPLTESHGKELLMLYLEDFHAKTSALLERGGVLLQAEVQCGNTWRELLAKFDPDTALWKTAQCLLLEDSEQSLEIWPRWGSMRNGECYQQPMLVQITKEKESGLLPTPLARDGKGPRSIQALKNAGRGKTNSLPDYLKVQKNWQYPPVVIVEYMMGWPQGWTDLKPLEMDKSPYVQQQPGNY